MASLAGWQRSATGLTPELNSSKCALEALGITVFARVLLFHCRLGDPATGLGSGRLLRCGRSADGCFLRWETVPRVGRATAHLGLHPGPPSYRVLSVWHILVLSALGISTCIWHFLVPCALGASAGIEICVHWTALLLRWRIIVCCRDLVIWRTLLPHSPEATTDIATCVRWLALVLCWHHALSRRSLLTIIG